MVFYDNTFRRELIYPGGPPTTSQRSQTPSTRDHARSSIGEPPQKPSPSTYTRFTKPVLRPPIESAQYLSLTYTDRLAELGIAPSVGSRGDSYHNALAEAVNAAYKTELINRDKPWRCVDDVELSTAEWAAWYNQDRLHEALGYVPPNEYEAALTGTSQPASAPTPALASE